VVVCTLYSQVKASSKRHGDFHCLVMIFLFYFSSRRRHTRSKRDWNVCSSDLMLFVYLAMIVIVVSWIVSQFNVSFIQPGVEEKVYIQNLLSAEGIQYMLESMIENFVTFKP